MAAHDQNLKALIVDDNQFMISLTKNILKKLEIAPPLEACDGATALQRLDDAAVDFVVCDLNMPGMDGIEFLRHLANRDSCPAVILSSGEEKGVLETAARLGKAHGLRILGTVPKPMKREPLEALLEKLVTGEEATSRSMSERLTPEEIRRGLQGDSVNLVFQPKVSIADREVVGVETLLRWNDPERGLMGPNAVVPVAESCGLINELTEAVFRKAMAQCGVWRAEGLDFKVAVNVSLDNLDQLDFPEFIVATAEAAGVDPSSLVLEVTESRLMDDITAPLEILTRLRMKGVGLSIDDYGTGASTMQQLKRIPFTEIKIDREFVAGATGDDEARAMLISAVRLGKDLDLTVVAEGVETQAEWDLAASLGVDVVQGYYVAKPMPAEAFQGWLRDWRAGAIDVNGESNDR